MSKQDEFLADVRPPADDIFDFGLDQSAVATIAPTRTTEAQPVDSDINRIAPEITKIPGSSGGGLLGQIGGLIGGLLTSGLKALSGFNPLGMLSSITGFKMPKALSTVKNTLGNVVGKMTSAAKKVSNFLFGKKGKKDETELSSGTAGSKTVQGNMEEQTNKTTPAISRGSESSRVKGEVASSGSKPDAFQTAALTLAGTRIGGAAIAGLDNEPPLDTEEGADQGQVPEGIEAPEHAGSPGIAVEDSTKIAERNLVPAEESVIPVVPPEREGTAPAGKATETAISKAISQAKKRDKARTAPSRSASRKPPMPETSAGALASEVSAVGAELAAASNERAAVFQEKIDASLLSGKESRIRGSLTLDIDGIPAGEVMLDGRRDS